MNEYLKEIFGSLEIFIEDLDAKLNKQKEISNNFSKTIKKQGTQIQNLTHDNNQLQEKYDELLDILVEQRELLPIEWLDNQSPHALGAVVGSPFDIVYYANIYIKELMEGKINNEHK